MKLPSFLTRNIIANVGATAVIIAAIAFVLINTRSPKEQTLIVQGGDFIKEVSVSGRVIPAESVDLVFSQSGRVSRVYADVGDTVQKGAIIASLDNGDAYAEVEQKKAAYGAAEAELQALKKGTRPEKIAIAESETASAEVALIDAIRNAHTVADDTLHNRVDQFFYNSHTQQPKLTFLLAGQLKIDLEWERFLAEEMLARMEARMEGLSAENVASDAKTTAQDLDWLRTFLNKVAEAVNTLQPTSNLAQATIDGYRASVATARSNVQAATQTLSGTIAALAAAEKNISLEKAGAIAEDVAEQEARVASARADLDSARARYQKTLIIAPFGGVITVMNAKAGGSASSNSALISLMSNDVLQIESFVPEINAPHIAIGYEATVFLDAYGYDVPFAARVISLDPAETIRDGVSTYRAKLEFVENDTRVRSGMTANITITTDKKENVIAVPQGIIEERDGKKYVLVREGDVFSEREVTVGSVSSLGAVAILSGLEEGDEVLLVVAE